jgi:hypothetical protein
MSAREIGRRIYDVLGLAKWFFPPLLTRVQGFHTSSADIGLVEYGSGSRSCGTLANFVMVAGTIYWRLFTSPDEVATLTQLAVEVTVAGAAGKLIRMYLAENLDHNAILSYGDRMGPGKILADSGDLAADSTGLKTSGALSARLRPSRHYWIGIVSDGTPSCNAIGFSAAIPIGNVGGGGNPVTGLTTTGQALAVYAYAPAVTAQVGNTNTPWTRCTLT